MEELLLWGTPVCRRKMEAGPELDGEAAGVAGQELKVCGF